MLMSVSLIMVVVIISVTITMVVMSAHADQVILYKIMDMNVWVSRCTASACIVLSS